MSWCRCKAPLYSLNAQGHRDRLMGKENKKFDARIRPWYKAAVTENRPTWSVIYPDFTTFLPTITASMPVYDATDGSLLGVCATDFFLPQEMNQFLRSLKIGKTGSAFIMERSGLLVSTSTDEPNPTEQLPLVRSLHGAAFQSNALGISYFISIFIASNNFSRISGDRKLQFKGN
jgi:hypothetical protein